MIKNTKILNILVVILSVIFALNIFVPIMSSGANSSAGDQTTGGTTIDDEPFIPIDQPTNDKSNETPVTFTAEQLIEKAVSYINGDISCKSTANGTVKTNVKVVGDITQKVYTSIQRDTQGHRLCFNASVKSATIGVTVGRQTYTDGGTVYYREAKTVSDSFVATYNDGWNRMSESEYFNEFGLIPGNSYYNIDKSSILEYSKLQMGSTGYRCTIKLDPASQTAYIRNVEVMSGSSTRPVVKYINLTFITDLDGVPSRVAAEECYVITVMGFTATCTNSVTTKYTNWGKYFAIQRPNGVK